MTVEDDVLRRIRPTNKEKKKITDAVDDLRAHVQAYLDEHGIDAELRLVGSFSKDTFLSNPDIDLFMLFPPETPKQDMEKTGLAVGEDVLHGVRMYSEHPYTHGNWKGIDVDLVPSYHLQDTEKLQTAVDRTPFHTQYVLSHMKEGQHDQVRLLKKFMKGIGTYGAEPDTRGFSGYLCELLVIKYGSFDRVLQAASTEWKKGTTIEVEEKGPPMIGPLIVYDPVDRKRNVASAVHLDSMALFIVAAKDYLRNPDTKFFFPKKRVPLTRRQLEKIASLHGSRILIVTFKRPNIIEENIYSQLWKTQDALAKKLNDFDFGVLRAVHDITDDKLEIAFELDRDILSKTVKHVGPPVWVHAADNFLAKWKGNECGEPFVENGAWTTITERMYSTAGEMLEGESAMAGIGREIDPASMKILGHEESVEHGNKMLLTDLMKPILRWCL